MTVGAAVGLGIGEGVAVAVAVGLGVGEGVAVAVAVGLGVGKGVAVAVAVEPGFGEGVAVALGMLSLSPPPQAASKTAKAKDERSKGGAFCDDLQYMSKLSA